MTTLWSGMQVTTEMSSVSTVSLTGRTLLARDVCMFTLCLRGFSLGSPESAGLTGDSKLAMNASFFVQNKALCECMVCLE